MRAWPSLTALLTGTLTLAFFFHERPPTTGHMVAGIAIGVPTFVLVCAIAALPRSRPTAIRLVLLQVITSAAAAAALLDQRIDRPVIVRLLPLLLFAIPVLGTAKQIGPAETSAPSRQWDLMSRVQTMSTPVLVLTLLSVATFAAMVGQATAVGLNCVNTQPDSDLMACLPQLWQASLDAANIGKWVALLLVAGLAVFLRKKHDVISK